MLRNIFLSHNCFISFSNAGAYTHLVLANFSPHFHSRSVRHMLSFKLKRPALSFENTFLYSLRLLTLKKRTLKVLFSYRNCMRAAFAMQVFLTGWKAVMKTAGLRSWTICAGTETGVECETRPIDGKILTFFLLSETTWFPPLCFLFRTLSFDLSSNPCA